MLTPKSLSSEKARAFDTRKKTGHIFNHRRSAGRPKGRHPGNGLTAISLLLGFASSASAHAELFVNAQAGIDILPGVPIAFNDCSSPAAPCRTLPWAITRASINETINLENGPFRPYSSNAAFTGADIEIQKSLTIQGVGSSPVVINAEHVGRHFNLVSGGAAVNLTLNDLKLINGSANAGGSIRVGSGNTVTLNNAVVKNNDAEGSGGGVHLDSGATLRASSSRFAGNSALFGGAIAATDATVVIENSSVLRANAAHYSGGGVFFASENGSALTISESEVELNQAELAGGAIFQTGNGNGGEIHSSQTNYYRNSAVSSGGAIAVDATGLLTITEDTFEKNTSQLGGGLYSARLGAGSTLVRRSTFVDNNAGLSGGAIHYNGFVLDDNAFIANTTLSGNSSDIGAAIRAMGAANLRIANTTLIQNVPTTQGAIYHDSSVELGIQNSIITQSGGAADCYNPSLSGVTGYHNLSDNCGTAGTDFNLGPVTGLNPLLGDSGGPTDTHRLMATSNAIDSGYKDCADPKLGTPLSWDQRGSNFPRVIDGDSDETPICDIGAFEYVPPVAVPLF